MLIICPATAPASPRGPIPLPTSAAPTCARRRAAGPAVSDPPETPRTDRTARRRAEPPPASRRLPASYPLLEPDDGLDGDVEVLVFRPARRADDEADAGAADAE